MSGRPPIAGDFLSLLDSHQFPALRGLSGEAPVQTQATTVFAFHFKDGVLMAGDRRATAGNMIVTDEVDKILEIDHESMLAIAGVPAMAFEMARVLENSFEYFRRSQLQPMSLQAKVRSLARLLRENLPMTMQGVGIVVPLFACLDHSGETPEPRIFFYDPLGAQFQGVGHVASGSGSVVIKGIMSYEERFGDSPAKMNQDEAVRFALRLLMTASVFDSATGGVDPAARHYATLKVLDANGVRSIPQEDQERVLKS